jgi:subtilisin family serine protease
VSDDDGHGTMTTGIVVARTGNGVGIAGEAPATQALVMKVFANHSGAAGYSAYDSDVSSAIVWAVQHGARVVNLSLGPSVPLVSGALGDSIPTYVQWAQQNGAAVAIAAGNSYIPAADYLSMSQHALVVGALGPSGAVATYSQKGVGVNLYAPGGNGPGGSVSQDVVSTFPTYTLPAANNPLAANVAPGYAAYDGTSFATPYAAGALALLIAHGLSPEQARQRILASTRDLGGVPVLDTPAAVGTDCPVGGRGPAGAGGQAPAPGQQGATGSGASGHTGAGAASGPASHASGGASASASPANGTQGNQPAAPPASDPTSTPGHADPWIVIGLVLLVVVGGPLLVRLRAGARP